MKRFEIYFRLIRIPVDFVLAYFALYVTYILRKTEFVSRFLEPVDMGYIGASSDYFELSFVLTFGLLVIFSFMKLYSLKSIDSFSTQVKKVSLSVLIWLMSIITYYFLIRSFPFSRSVILFNSVAVIAFVCIGRLAVHLVQNFSLKRGIGVRKVILVGGSKGMLERVAVALGRDFHYEVLGYIGQKKFKSDILAYKYYLGGFEKLKNIFKRREFDDVIHIGRQGSDIQNFELINFCRIYHKDYQYVPDVLEVQRQNVLLSSIGGLPVFRVKPTSLDGWGRVFKKIFDIVLSSLLLIILFPLFLLISVLILIDSPGPIFFRKDDKGKVIKRAGYRGKDFHCWKFRTMKHNTHSMRDNELAADNIRKGALVKIKNDPRITKFGKFLRRFDLDELPQLMNVLTGTMSLVGPRPHLLEEVAKYQEHERFVFTVKPGITGLAQVSGRSDLGFEEEVSLDTYYIENWTLFMDVKILFRTIGVVFKGHGEFKI
jgi:exopolysaccharide biosynthesis polyprenyl glycosylphosphotransferase